MDINDKYYFQIFGLLHITNINECDFILYACETQLPVILCIVTITKDSNWWNTNYKKLEKVFFNIIARINILK
jgi:hypothetical protein